MFRKRVRWRPFLFDILGNDGILSNEKFIINSLTLLFYEKNY